MRSTIVELVYTALVCTAGVYTDTIDTDFIRDRERNLQSSFFQAKKVMVFLRARPRAPGP